MLDEIFGSGTLNVIYAAVVFISFIFAMLALLGGEIGDIFHLDLDFDADGDGVFDFISISPFSLATFGVTFGATGLVTRLWLEMDQIPSVIWSTAVGVLVGGVAQAFFIYILSPTKSGHINLAEDALGREVEVITTIPGTGLGEIAFDSASGHVKLGARSAEGKQIKRGQVVIIERVAGRVAIVRPMED